MAPITLALQLLCRIDITHQEGDGIAHPVGTAFGDAQSQLGAHKRDHATSRFSEGFLDSSLECFVEGSEKDSERDCLFAIVQGVSFEGCHSDGVCLLLPLLLHQSYCASRAGCGSTSR